MLFLASLFSLAVAAPPDLDQPHSTGSVVSNDAAAVLFVEDYVRLKDVDGASRDGALMKSTFIQSVGIPSASVKTVTSGSRSRMKSTVQSAAKRVKAGGTLWVYFSGYGLVRNGEWILLGKDTRRDGSTATRDGVRLEEIYTWSKRKNISRVVIILDASFGGSHRDGTRVISPPPPTPPRFQGPQDERIVVWMADHRARTAPHYRAADHGMFTYLVAGALRGWADGALTGRKDGKLLLGEAQRFVRLHTHALGSAHAANETQNPTQKEWLLFSGKMAKGPGRAAWDALAKVEQNLQVVQAVGRYRLQAQAAYEMATTSDDPEVRKEALEAFVKHFGRPELVVRSSLWIPEVEQALRDLDAGGEAPALAELDNQQTDPETPVTKENTESVGEDSKTPEVKTPPKVEEPVVVVEQPPPPGLPKNCRNLLALEPYALMGQLTVSLKECLEARLKKSEQQTVQNKISRVLMMDAEARRQSLRLEKLMKRHLEEIDRSDPDLCFKYALALSRKGVSHSEEVIRWVGYSLENKQEWTKSTFKKRVFSLFKLRAEMANRLWSSWDAKYIKDRDAESQANAEMWRNNTKQYAKEWLDYAKLSSQRIKRARNLCITAAGTADFCEAAVEE